MKVATIHTQKFDSRDDLDDITRQLESAGISGLIMYSPFSGGDNSDLPIVEVDGHFYEGAKQLSDYLEHGKKGTETEPERLTKRYRLIKDMVRESIEATEKWECCMSLYQSRLLEFQIGDRHTVGDIMWSSLAQENKKNAKKRQGK